MLLIVFIYLIGLLMLIYLGNDIENNKLEDMVETGHYFISREQIVQYLSKYGNFVLPSFVKVDEYKNTKIIQDSKNNTKNNESGATATTIIISDEEKREKELLNRFNRNNKR